ncbi:MAG TPA: hypothetical protein VJU83_06165 [Burkholderiales bacterium]|nr:hypothetical protein [Burkholderiales bacterium]
MIASTIASALNLRRRPKADGAQSDVDYLSVGRAANEAELATGEDSLLFRLLHEEEGFDGIMDIPYSLKHLKDVHAVMRLAVAEVGETHEELTQHPLFHPAFGAFALGFCLGSGAAHRAKHLGWQGNAAQLNHIQIEQCEAWGVEIATYYIAVVDAYGIFGKTSDVDLYGISDKWWVLAEQHRFDGVEVVQECVGAGRAAALQWSDDDSADVPALFQVALERVVSTGPADRF